MRCFFVTCPTELLKLTEHGCAERERAVIVCRLRNVHAERLDERFDADAPVLPGAWISKVEVTCDPKGTTRMRLANF